MDMQFHVTTEAGPVEMLSPPSQGLSISEVALPHRAMHQPQGLGAELAGDQQLEHVVSQLRSSPLFTGAGQSFTAATLAGSVATLRLLIMCPKKAFSLWRSWHFFGLNRSPASRTAKNTLQRFLSDRKSSFCFRALGHPHLPIGTTEIQRGEPTGPRYGCGFRFPHKK